MNGRSILFIFAATAIMMAAMWLQEQNNPQPQVDTANVTDTVAPVDRETSTESDAAQDATPDAAAVGTTSPATDASDQSTDDVATDSATASLKEPTEPTEPTNSAQAAAANKTPSEETASNGLVPNVDDLITLGSIAADAQERFLVTANRIGGTIYRVELNFRKSGSDQIVYRDLEWTGGYLGQLELLDSPDGYLVRAVGAGTPAADAGIQVGDAITAINGVPVTSIDDFYLMLAKTNPQESITLTLNRNGAEITATAQLTAMPIQLIRPENTRVVEGVKLPESFVLSLLKTRPELDKAWPDLDRDLRVARWDIDEAQTNDRQVAFTRTLTTEQLTPFDLTGPLKVTKLYQLPEVPAADLNKLSSRTFHIQLTIKIENEAETPQTVAYELDGPAGATTEAWWYTMKIHGRSSAIGYVAGARDVVGSNNAESFVFYGGPEIVDGAEDSPPVLNFICDPYEEAVENRQLNFAGVDTQYFNISIVPQMPDDQPFEVNSLSAFVNGYGYQLPENARLKKLVDCTFQMVKTVELPAGGSYEQTFDIFAGPKEPKLLEAYGLSEIETFGWFAMFSKPLLWLLHLFYKLTFSFSYGLAIIMLTILVRSCMIPFSRKAALSAQMMQHLQPQMMEIKKKYPDDIQKQSQAQRELFTRHKYSPLSGCLPMFFQLPIFIGLYRGLSVDVALRDKPLIPGMSWCSDLSAPDQLLYWKDWMPTWLGDETGWLGPFLNILPILTMVLFMAQQKLFMPKAVDEQQKMMQSMMSFMMPVMGLMFFKVPAGLCLYIITSSVWGIVEKLALPKPVLDTSKFDANGSSPTLAFGGSPNAVDDSAMKAKALANRDEKKKLDAERKKRLRDRK